MASALNEPFGAGWGRRIIQATPEGPITDADPPVAVRCLVGLNNGTDVIVPAAWALAWTRLQVLVMWRHPDERHPIIVWLPATRVRHKDSPIR